MLNGVTIKSIYVDEMADVNPKDYDKCRTCGVWKLIHYKVGQELYYKESCKDYLPTDNLLYLELMENRIKLRRWYEQAGRDLK